MGWDFFLSGWYLEDDGDSKKDIMNNSTMESREEFFVELIYN